MARYRPVSKFKSYTHQALCTAVQNIFTTSSGNPLLRPEVAAEWERFNQTATDALAILNTLPTTTANILSGDLQYAAAAIVPVAANFTAMADYVEGVSNGDGAVIKSFGFEVDQVA